MKKCARRACAVSLAVGIAAGCASAPVAATLYAATDRGEILTSADDGVTWSPLSGLPTRQIAALTPGSIAGVLLAATRDGDIFETDENGSSALLVATLAASDVTDLLVDGDDVFVLTTTGDVWASFGGTGAFDVIGSVVASDAEALTTSTSGLAMLTRRGIVHESADGVTWQSSAALAASDCTGIVEREGTLVVTTTAGDHWQRAGAGFQHVGSVGQTGVVDILVDGHGRLLAVTDAGEVAASTDGQTWGWIGAIGQLGVVALAGDPRTLGVETSPAVRHPRLRVSPNPIGATGRIDVHLVAERAGLVVLDVFDAQGRRLAPPTFRQLDRPGAQDWSVRPPEGAPAVVFLRLRGDGWRLTRRLVLAR